MAIEQLLDDLTGAHIPQDICSVEYLPSLVTGLMAGRTDSLHSRDVAELESKRADFIRSYLKRGIPLGDQLALVAGYRASIRRETLEDIRQRFGV